MSNFDYHKFGFDREIVTEDKPFGFSDDGVLDEMRLLLLSSEPAIRMIAAQILSALSETTEGCKSLFCSGCIPNLISRVDDPCCGSVVANVIYNMSKYSECAKLIIQEPILSFILKAVRDPEVTWYDQLCKAIAVAFATATEIKNVVNSFASVLIALDSGNELPLGSSDTIHAVKDTILDSILNTVTYDAMPKGEFSIMYLAASKKERSVRRTKYLYHALANAFTVTYNRQSVTSLFWSGILPQLNVGLCVFFGEGRIVDGREGVMGLLLNSLLYVLESEQDLSLSGAKTSDCIRRWMNILSQYSKNRNTWTETEMKIITSTIELLGVHGWGQFLYDGNDDRSTGSISASICSRFKISIRPSAASKPPDDAMEESGETVGQLGELSYYGPASLVAEAKFTGE